MSDINDRDTPMNAERWPATNCSCQTRLMQVERLKYIVWAADMNRAVAFYTKVFGGTVLKQNEVIAEVSIGGRRHWHPW